MSIILLADSNPGAYACTLLANELAQEHLDCLVVTTERISSLVSPLPENPAGNGRVAQLNCSINELLLSSLILKATAIGVFIRASNVETFVTNYRQICQLNAQRPAPVFSGPVFPLAGDTLIEDLLPRMCCDLLCLHGERQLEEAHDLMHRWPNPVPTVAIGFWFMPEAPETGGLVGAGKPDSPHTLVVLAQKGLPKLKGAAERMLRLLGQKASASPHWQVLIQTDHTQSEKQLPLNADQRVLAELPRNISFGASGNLPIVLGRCSACITISSPWIYTAMAWGRAVVVMADHGIRTDHGSVPFSSSGVMHRLDSITALDDLLEMPIVNSNWLEKMGWGVHDGASQLVKALRTRAKPEASQ